MIHRTVCDHWSSFLGAGRRDFATAGVAGVNSCQAASIKPRNSTFNDGGVPKGNFTLYHAWIGRAEGGLGDTCIEF